MTTSAPPSPSSTFIPKITPLSDDSCFLKKLLKLSGDIPEIIKTILFAMSIIMIACEIVEFIKLRGFENPIAYCLFKLIVYTISMLVIKCNDSTLELVYQTLKELNENLSTKLEEIKGRPTRRRAGTTVNELSK